MKPTDIKVSIIIPIYNVVTYIVQCLESVRNQTLKDIEIICVDDGSTDTSLEILRQYEKNDPRIKVYSKPNSGYGHTINYGLERSSGKYIAIVESDDFIDEKGIETLYECAERYRADYVRSNFYEFRNGQDEVNASLDSYPYNEVFSPLQDFSIFYAIAVSPWPCIYNKRFLLKNNIKMNETPGASYQDASWQFLVFLRASRVVFLKEAFYHYRLDNLSSSIHSVKKVFCQVDEKNYIEKKLAEYQISDPEILGVYARVINDNYRWNYRRISGEFQYAFLLEWKKEISKQSKRGILKKKFFEKEQWDEMERIIHWTDDYFEETAKVYMMKNVYEHTINREMYFEVFDNKISLDKIAIFGTGTVAREVIDYMKEKKILENVICFCETNPVKKSFYGKPIFSVREFPYPKEMLIICATDENIQKEIVNGLQISGFSNILSIDRNLRTGMMYMRDGGSV